MKLRLFIHSFMGFTDRAVKEEKSQSLKSRAVFLRLKWFEENIFSV